jgi:LytS/YehU family sensor histidine kinase
VQHFLLHDQKREGLLYLGKLGTLLRLILNNSEKDLVPLDQELDLIQHYLEMEQMRTNNKFEFEIHQPQGLALDQMLFPGMVLQVLVENAIWHGAVPREGKGRIEIIVEGTEQDFTVKVLDNGPGLTHPPAALDKEKHTSMGLTLVRRRLGRLARRKGMTRKAPLTLTISDWRPDGHELAGTEAKITVQTQ